MIAAQPLASQKQLDKINEVLECVKLDGKESWEMVEQPAKKLKMIENEESPVDADDGESDASDDDGAWLKEGLVPFDFGSLDLEQGPEDMKVYEGPKDLGPYDNVLCCFQVSYKK